MKKILITGCAVVLAFSGCRQQTLFTLMPASSTGIDFNNRIVESDSLNPLNEINLYNGGGVGIGDFNQDGLQDIFFSGNLVSNRLYLNKGKLRFQDITAGAGVSGNGRWCRGVSVVDINSDGKDDIYVSVSMSKNRESVQNLLYVNQGTDQSGTPVFKELAAEYGLNDDSQTTMADFFDYDNDGDLDVYLVVNEHAENENQNIFRPILTDGSHPSTGRLYRNDWNGPLRHGVYKNVSREAGINIQGYGHSSIISDINADGWKDIYITNDFITSNILYINNHDGTFTDRSKEYFKQTSLFSMGVDMQDLNNDGLLDVVELDMNPQDNYRKKMMLGPNNYQYVQNFEKYGYQLQYSRNTVQINQGRAPLENDSFSHPLFSQLGYLCGVAETDWSWTPMVTDFDNDGLRDLVITNGFPKDITDHDFMVFRANASPAAGINDILSQVPKVKLHNYAFRNLNGLQFENSTGSWGLDAPSFSNGAVYADLDNDGDMDVVVNNINDEAFLYQNNASANPANHYLNIAFSGDTKNRSGFGAWVTVFLGGEKKQVYEHNPYRGYLSSVQNLAHFGVGPVKVIDSVVIVWPDHNMQTLQRVSADQTITLFHKNAAQTGDFGHLQGPPSLFIDITGSSGISYSQRKRDYIDFNVQKLLPHKLSEYSPALAAGDLNGDGIDDLVCGGDSKNPAQLFFQQRSGKFIQRDLFVPSSDTMMHPYGKYSILTDVDFNDEGLLIFDADGDGDQDIYISSGGYEHDPGTAAYQDRLYVNDGKGKFLIDKRALPENFTSKFCVRAVDYDKDGDLDLFVAGRVEPWTYPRPVSSMILRNDSHSGHPQFTDATPGVAPGLINAGLTCDAAFSDFDNDGWMDLVLAQEWMPLRFFRNNKGSFIEVTASSGISRHTGWWNSLAPGDFDNDGDIDYVAGNLGLNSFYKASAAYPVHITSGYLDKNASYDAFPSVFLPASQSDTQRREYSANQWEDVSKQMIGMRAKFPNYNAYATTTFEQLFAPGQIEGALRLEANTFASAFVRNDGNGHFTLTPLPVEAQVSVLTGMVVEDYDGDGNLDVVINGNDFGTDVTSGRSDALNGLYLQGDGKGNFRSLSMEQSGIYIPGNGRALTQLRSANGNTLLAATQHNGPMKIFQLRKNRPSVDCGTDDISAVITFASGATQKRDLSYGYSFLSQSARRILTGGKMISIDFEHLKGTKTRVPVK